MCYVCSRSTLARVVALYGAVCRYLRHSCGCYSYAKPWAAPNQERKCCSSRGILSGKWPGALGFCLTTHKICLAFETGRAVPASECAALPRAGDAPSSSSEMSAREPGSTKSSAGGALLFPGGGGHLPLWGAESIFPRLQTLPTPPVW